MFRPNRIPQWVRDFLFVALCTVSWWFGQGLTHQKDADPAWFPVFLFIGVRILMRITQLEQKLSGGERRTDGTSGVDEIRWPKPEGPVRWHDDAGVKP